MNYPFRILIADRNRHVREFLRREFSDAGYLVDVAGDGRELFTRIEGVESPDLLILDLEIPHLEGIDVLGLLRERQPRLPVVVHAFLTEHANQPALDTAAALVEKKGDTDGLKKAVRQVLENYYPQRFGAAVGA